MSVIGLEKSLMFGSEGKGSIDESLFRSEEIDFSGVEISEAIEGNGFEEKL